MNRIRFLSDQIYETAGPGKGPTFPAGFVLDIGDVGAALGRSTDPAYSARFLERWVQRGVAERVNDAGGASDPQIVARSFAAPSFAATGDAAGEEADGDDDELAAKTVAELKALALAETTDLGSATKKDDIVAAIRTARAAR